MIDGYMEKGPGGWEPMLDGATPASQMDPNEENQQLNLVNQLQKCEKIMSLFWALHFEVVSQ